MVEATSPQLTKLDSGRLPVRDSLRYAAAAMKTVDFEPELAGAGAGGGTIALNTPAPAEDAVKVRSQLAEVEKITAASAAPKEPQEQ